MSDQTLAEVLRQLDELRKRYEELQAAHEDLAADLESWKQETAELAARVNDHGVSLKQLIRPKMTNDEALETFDVLKRVNQSLTLPSFAAQYGLSYEALRKARLRKQKKSGTSPK